MEHNVSNEAHALTLYKASFCNANSWEASPCPNTSTGLSSCTGTSFKSITIVGRAVQPLLESNVAAG
jgi:hypothetical protein